MEKALLESVIDECSARGDHDFIKDAINKKTGGMRIFGYEHTGYCAKIDSLKSYYTANMDFLVRSIRKEVFSRERLIYTKTKDEKYKYRWIIPAIGYTAIIQSHLISTEIVGGFTIIICLLLFKKTFKNT